MLERACSARLHLREDRGMQHCALEDRTPELLRLLPPSCRLQECRLKVAHLTFEGFINSWKTRAHSLILGFIVACFAAEKSKSMNV